MTGGATLRGLLAGILGLALLAGLGAALPAAAQAQGSGASQNRASERPSDGKDGARRSGGPRVKEARRAQPRHAQARKKAGNSARAEAAPRARATAPARARAASPERRVAAVPARLSFGQMAGLHSTPDPLDLQSSVALVIDKETDQVLFSKNSEAVLPIASITKLMTALVVVEAGLPLAEPLTISQADVDTEKGSRSRLHVGAVLSRGQMLHLALMASENRAAHALGRHYPGGLPAFVEAMNRKAAALGMHRTRYVEPTGLSSSNQSSALDLSVLVRAASEHALIRELSTASDARVAVGRRELEFRNTNGLIRNPEWDIGLQKTGYISEAGRCVVMQAQLAGRQLIMVLLDSAGRYSRIGDAERLRSWVAASIPSAQAAPWSATGR
jgi:D-alanyl-D-alanine endopeptidase (penicillin-binding protein 7)